MLKKRHYDEFQLSITLGNNLVSGGLVIYSHNWEHKDMQILGDIYSKLATK